jgi:hypothetical protein
VEDLSTAAMWTVRGMLDVSKEYRFFFAWFDVRIVNCFAYLPHSIHRFTSY